MKLSQALYNLNGEPLMYDEKVLSLGSAIAYCLLGRKSDPHKSYLLAVKLHTEEDMELDNADLSFIKDTLSSSTTFTPIVTGQILELLNQSK